MCKASHGVVRMSSSRVRMGPRATIHGVSQPEVEQRAPDAAGPGDPHAEHREATPFTERLTRHLVLYGLALVALQLGFRAWALAGSWFYFDDVAFMSRAMDQR